MAALGGKPAARITTRVESMLKAVAKSGVSARSVNEHRSVVSAIFNYGCKESTFGLPSIPIPGPTSAREPSGTRSPYYSPENVEALARALEEGKHRDPSRPALSHEEKAVHGR